MRQRRQGRSRAHPAEVPEGRVAQGFAVADEDGGRLRRKAPLAPRAAHYQSDDAQQRQEAERRACACHYLVRAKQAAAFQFQQISRMHSLPCQTSVGFRSYGALQRQPSAAHDMA